MSGDKCFLVINFSLFAVLQTARTVGKELNKKLLEVLREESAAGAKRKKVGFLH